MKIHMIIGSTREGRVSGGVADWVERESKATGHEIVRVDLRDHELPFVDGAPPSVLHGQYLHQSVQTWSKVIAEAQAFIFIAPEYNHGYSAVLKNALDWLYGEWSGKAAGIVSYSGGFAAGLRSAEQLKLVFSHLGLRTTQTHVALPNIRNADGSDIDAQAVNQLAPMLEQIVQLTTKSS